MNTIAIYPGTFDPITNGHLDLIKRASFMFDQVIVGVAASPTKSPMFNLAQRVDMAHQVVKDMENVTAEGFSGLLIDFAKKKQAKLLIRGLRTTMDFEYELGLTYMYKQLVPQLESVFLPPASEFAFLSSTMVREVAIHGGSVQRFVPSCVNDYIKLKFE